MSPAVGGKKGKVPGVLSASYFSFHLILSSYIKYSDHCCYTVIEETEV